MPRAHSCSVQVDLAAEKLAVTSALVGLLSRGTENLRFREGGLLQRARLTVQQAFFVGAQNAPWLAGCFWLAGCLEGSLLLLQPPASHPTGASPSLDERLCHSQTRIETLSPHVRAIPLVITLIVVSELVSCPSFLELRRVLPAKFVFSACLETTPRVHPSDVSDSDPFSSSFNINRPSSTLHHPSSS